MVFSDRPVLRSCSLASHPSRLHPDPLTAVKQDVQPRMNTRLNTGLVDQSDTPNGLRF